MPKCIILVGIPCSGKSSWAKKQIGWVIISRDDVREQLYGKGYNYKQVNETLVTKLFNSSLLLAIEEKKDVILDNTHCKSKYIHQYDNDLKGYEIIIKKFPIPYWKACIRNIWRWVTTGKFIPWNVMKNMQKNYKNLKE